MAALRVAKFNFLVAALSVLAPHWLTIAFVMPPGPVANEEVPNTPHLVTLRRELSPVISRGKVVSFKTSYAGSIQLGVPAQEFNVVFDTGSGHIVLPGTTCDTKGCENKTRYDISRSTDAVSMNIDGSAADVDGTRDLVTIGFGTGRIKGELIQDLACVGPDSTATNASALSSSGASDSACVKLGVVVAVEMSENPFSVFKFDGIVGLGLTALTLNPNFSFFGSLASSGRISRPHFSFFLSDSEDGETTSELAIGGHNVQHLLHPDEPLKWANVANAENGHWQVRIRSLYVAGRRIDMCGAEADCRGIVDTGSSHLGLPGANYDEIEELLTAPASQLLDCRLAPAPEVTFEIDEGFNLTLFPKNYMRRLPIREDVQVTVVTSLGSNSSNNSEAGTTLEPEDTEPASEEVVPRWCRPRLMPVVIGPPLGPNIFLFGEALLKQYYTVFDWSGPRVGFGLSAQSQDEPEAGEEGNGALPRDVDVYLMQQSVRVNRRGRSRLPRRVTAWLVVEQIEC